MVENEVRCWKKVYVSDLPYISYELKESINTPAVIILEGQLGAGKTTFSKVFMGSENDETMSPSYSLVYESGDTLHADMYRIKDREEIIQLELPLYLEHKKFFLVEWGKKFVHYLLKEVPEDFHTYLLEITVNEQVNEQEEQTRNFTLYEFRDW